MLLTLKLTDRKEAEAVLDLKDIYVYLALKDALILHLTMRLRQKAVFVMI